MLTPLPPETLLTSPPQIQNPEKYTELYSYNPLCRALTRLFCPSSLEQTIPAAGIEASAFTCFVITLLWFCSHVLHNDSESCLTSRLQTFFNNRFYTTLMYKTTVYTLVNGVITHQKQQISEKKVILRSSVNVLR